MPDGQSVTPPEEQVMYESLKPEVAVARFDGIVAPFIADAEKIPQGQ